MLQIKKIKQYFRVTIEINFGKHVNYREIYEANVNYIFNRVIWPKHVVEDKYNAVYKLLKDHDKAKEVTFNSLREDQILVSLEELKILNQKITKPKDVSLFVN